MFSLWVSWTSAAVALSIAVMLLVEGRSKR